MKKFARQCEQMAKFLNHHKSGATPKFEDADTDKDGKVSEKEMLVYGPKLGQKKENIQKTYDCLDGLDKIKDNGLNKTEFEMIGKASCQSPGRSSFASFIYVYQALISN